MAYATQRLEKRKKVVEVERRSYKDWFSEYFYLFNRWDESQIVECSIGDCIPNTAEFLGLSPDDKTKLIFRDILPRPRGLLDLDTEVVYRLLNKNTKRLKQGLFKRFLNADEFGNETLDIIRDHVRSVFTSAYEEAWYYSHRYFRVFGDSSRQTQIVFTVRILDRSNTTDYISKEQWDKGRLVNPFIASYKEKLQSKQLRRDRRTPERRNREGWGNLDLFQENEREQT